MPNERATRDIGFAGSEGGEPARAEHAEPAGPWQSECSDMPTVLITAWVLWSAGLVANAWMLSAFGALRSCHWTSGLWTALVIGWVLKRLRGQPRAELLWLRFVFSFPPFLIFLALFLAIIAIYPATSHDSLSYRLPRMLLWLQEGAIRHVPAVDERLNFLAPNWELMSLPFFQIGRESLLEVVNVASWVTIYLMTAGWMRRWVSSPAKVRWLALFSVLPMQFVLQAASTMSDLTVASFLLASVYFIGQAEEKRSGAAILLSGLALALAAGTKQMFAVLALPWLVWFFASPSRPWRYCPWRHVPLAGGLALLASPLPVSVLNILSHGSWSGGFEDRGTPLWNPFAGAIMYAAQLLELPFFPFASRWNAWTDSFVAGSALQQQVPSFHLNVHLVPVLDWASSGLVFTAILIAGLWCARREPAIRPRWLLWASLGGVFSFFLATTQTVPTMIGRSFLGFALLSLPLGLWGLSRLSDKVIARMGFILIAVSLFGLALCPANPLWPVKSVAQRLEHAHASEGIVGAVRKYGSYTERYYCGRSLVARIPADVQRLGAIMGREPLLQLWHPYSFRRSVVLFNLRTTVRQVENSGLDWIVIGGDACEFMPTLIDGLLGSSRFHLVAEEQYVSKLQRGPEPWRLLKRVE